MPSSPSSPLSPTDPPPEAPTGSRPWVRYSGWLWLLLLLFVLRVVGQLLVALFQVSFLPPMQEWYSGVVPYGPLLLSQVAIILLAGKICVDFSRGHGFFITPHPRLGRGLLVFGSLYLGVMLIRYGIRMSLYPLERWVGGSIPIFFHWVLASFVLVLGHYHWLGSRGLQKGPAPGQRQ